MATISERMTSYAKPTVKVVAAATLGYISDGIPGAVLSGACSVLNMLPENRLNPLSRLITPILASRITGRLFARIQPLGIVQRAVKLVGEVVGESAALPTTFLIIGAAALVQNRLRARNHPAAR
jgi:hypothetical protein